MRRYILLMFCCLCGCSDSRTTDREEVRDNFGKLRQHLFLGDSVQFLKMSDPSYFIQYRHDASELVKDVSWVSQPEFAPSGKEVVYLQNDEARLIPGGGSWGRALLFRKRNGSWLLVGLSYVVDEN